MPCHLHFQVSSQHPRLKRGEIARSVFVIAGKLINLSRKTLAATLPLLVLNQNYTVRLMFEGILIFLELSMGGRYQLSGYKLYEVYIEITCRDVF